MNLIYTLLIVAFTMISFGSSAHADTDALWAEFGNGWSVYGNSDTRTCLAIGSYTNGRQLVVSFNPKGASLAVGGISVAKGETYKIFVKASSGDAGTLSGVAINSSLVIFENITYNTVKAVAFSRSLNINGLGPFELKGSRKAIASAWDCYEALSSI